MRSSHAAHGSTILSGAFSKLIFVDTFNPRFTCDYFIHSNSILISVCTQKTQTARSLSFFSLVGQERTLRAARNEGATLSTD